MITFEPNVVDENTQFVTTKVTASMSGNSWGLKRFMQDAMFHGTSTLRTERAPAQQAQALPTVLNPPPEAPKPPEPPPTTEPKSTPEPATTPSSPTEPEPFPL